jgi:putative Mg2+ transporter-C (MgtC) family protein
MDFLTLILRLIISIFLCGVLGFERQVHNRPLGIRTNALVGLGATLITVVTLELIAQYPTMAFNPAFLILAIIPGIGFMGSGIIYKTGESVVGLTTAATLWVTAALGLIIGLGYYFEAIVVTILTLFILLFFKKIEEWLAKKK